MEAYTYSTEDTANGSINPGKFQPQVQAAGLATQGIVATGTEVANGQYEDGTFDVLFEQPLTDSQKATLDGVVAAHAGSPTVSFVFRASAEVVHDAVDLGAAWTDLGGVVTAIDFFVPDLTKAFSRIVGDSNVTGAGAKLRVVEGSGASERVVSAEVSLPDTGGAWKLLPTFNTNKPPSAGQNLYRLQGKLNGATSAQVRFVSMSLLEVLA